MYVSASVPAPTGPLHISCVTTNSASIGWYKPHSSAAASRVRRYVIEKSEGGKHAVWILCGYSSSNSEVYRLTHLTGGKKWMVRVYAENEDGRSEPLEGSFMTKKGGLCLSPMHAAFHEIPCYAGTGI